MAGKDAAHNGDLSSDQTSGFLLAEKGLCLEGELYQKLPVV